MNAGEADACGKLIDGKMPPVAGKNLRGIGTEDDAALPALQVAAAVVVQIKPVSVEDFQKQRTGGRGDFAKVLDLDPAFP
ncbi:hypothetical protein D3C83_204180 [compost metagenome]